MSPSIQCIFERTLAGLLLIVMGLGVAIGSIYAMGILHSKYRARFQKKEAVEPGPTRRKLEAFFRASGTVVFVVYFSAVGLWLCYFVGKGLLAKFGICHMK